MTNFFNTIRFYAILILRYTIFCIFILYVYTAYSIYIYSKQGECGSSDVAVVLGAAVWGDEPSPVFKERIKHAVDLYNEGKVGKIIFTGAQGQMGEPTEALAALHFANTLGFPIEDGLLEESSTTTKENVHDAFEIGIENGFETYIIVSDPIHMKRALKYANSLGISACSSPTPTSLYQSKKVKLDFLLRETFFYLTT
jgi:uncharacterized SAM-binding protein YcdF (DUF218 family)